MARPPKPAIAVIVVALIALIALGGWYVWQQRQASADGALTLSGNVDADETQVQSLVGGRVVEAKIAEGDQVKRGQVLYRIDDRALKLQVDQAVAGVKAARAAYKQTKDDDLSKADQAAARARWDQAKAAEKIARVQLSYATVKAPADGTVTAVTVSLGETASPGRTLATISKSGSVFVRGFVPEPKIGDIAVGDSATIVTDGGARVPAKVTFIASQAQFTPSNIETKDQRAKLVYEIRLTPESTDGLTPGMPVDVTFEQ